MAVYINILNEDFAGGNCVNVLGDCNVNTSDGDSTGDGLQNIDLGPTNQLLQQIRNSLESEDTWTGEISNSDGDIQQAETDAEEQEGDLLNPDNNNFGRNADGDQFAGDQGSRAADHEGRMGGLLTGQGSSCPAPVIQLPAGGSYTFNLDTGAALVRALFGFILWAFVGINGYFIFTRLALG